MTIHSRRHRLLQRLALERLESRSVPALMMLASGAGEGGAPQVKVFAPDGAVVANFFAFDSALRGGVHVATGDMTGDGIDDLVAAPGPGGGPHIKVFDGYSLMNGRADKVYDFMAYDLRFRGGVNIAIADVTGDGKNDIVTGAGIGGGPHVRVFDGTNAQPVRDYMAYDVNFRGGVSVAAGKVFGRHQADIVTAPGAGGGPHFKVIAGASGVVARDWIGFNAHARPNGYSLATGYLNDDAFAEIIVAPGVGGGPLVNAFDGVTGEVVREFAAFEAKSRGGAQVSTADMNGDGMSEIVASSGPGVATQARVFDGMSGAVTNTVNLFDPTFRGGASVAAMVPLDFSRAISRSFDFRQGDQGWIAGFANLLVGVSPQEWQLDAGIRPLPPELGAGTGFMLQGENRSAALQMFLKKSLGPKQGIEPGRAYRIRFAIDLGSNMSGQILLGGPVNLMVGAGGNEPRVVPVDGQLVLTMHHGDKPVSESGTTLLGNISTGVPGNNGVDPYVALSRVGTAEFTARADESGNLWLMVGTQSGFEGFTRLFYRRITVTLLPVAE